MGKQNTTLKYLNSNEKIWVEEKMLGYQVRAGPTFINLLGDYLRNLAEKYAVTNPPKNKQEILWGWR